MAEFRALMLWTDAWVADTKHLTRLERGTYIDLLILMWRTPRCRVPNDDQWLAKRMNMTMQEVKTELRPLLKEFCHSDGNTITQKRLLKEWSHCVTIRQRKSAAAKSMWRKKKQNAGAKYPYPYPYPYKERKKVPDASASSSQKKMDFAEASPVDEEPRARLFREGKTILIALGVSPKQSGAIIGKWLKTTPDCDGVLAALTYAFQNNVMEPIGYVTKLLNTGGSNGRGANRESFDERIKRLADEARRAERAAGIESAFDFKRGH